MCACAYMAVDLQTSASGRRVHCLSGSVAETTADPALSKAEHQVHRLSPFY